MLHKQTNKQTNKELLEMTVEVIFSHPAFADDH